MDTKKHDLIYWLLVISCLVLLVYYGVCIYYQIYRPAKSLIIVGIQDDQSGTLNTETPPPLHGKGQDVEQSTESSEVQDEATG